MFIDGHEWSDIIEDCKNFLKKIEKLKPYMVEFEEDGAMKAKTYPSDYAVRGPNERPIVVITHDKCTFSANNNIRKVWIWKRDMFLRSKSWGQGIITSKFILLFGRLNLAFLSPKKREEIIQETGLIEQKLLKFLSMKKIMMGIAMELNYINKWLKKLFLLRKYFI